MSTPVVQLTFGSILLGDQKFAGGAVERVGEAVAVEMRQQLAFLRRRSAGR